MRPPRHWWIVCVCLAGATRATTLPAQVPVKLGFLGFAPGASLTAVRAAFTANRGSGWNCRTARGDSSIAECRGTFPDPVHRQPVQLWASMIGGRAGIVTLRADVAAAVLEEWRGALVESYGPAPLRRQGAVRMMQWISNDRMLRLTWHGGPGGLEVSVSLVDGPVLDTWGRPRSGG